MALRNFLASRLSCAAAWARLKQTRLLFLACLGPFARVAIGGRELAAGARRESEAAELQNPSATNCCEFISRPETAPMLLRCCGGISARLRCIE